MTNEYIYFYNKNTGERLGGISIEGYSPGELQPTMELFAYDKGLNTSDIEMKIESLKGGE